MTNSVIITLLHTQPCYSLQEINAQPQSMLKDLFNDDPWTQRFKDLLGERGYVMIKSLQMQGLLLVMFTKREHLLHLRAVETDYTRTGLGGMWVGILHCRCSFRMCICIKSLSCCAGQ